VNFNIKTTGPNRIIVPGHFDNLYVPRGYQEGATNYIKTTLLRHDQEMESEEGFAEEFRDNMKK